MRRVLLILTLSLTIASVPISGYCETYNICNDECSVNIGDPNWEVYTQDNYQDAGDSSISSMFESGAADKQRLGGFIYNISFDEQIGTDENRPPTELEQERSATLAAIKAVFPFAILVIGYRWLKSKKKKQNENSESKDEIKD